MTGAVATPPPAATAAPAAPTAPTAATVGEVTISRLPDKVLQALAEPGRAAVVLSGTVAGETADGLTKVRTAAGEVLLKASPPLPADKPVTLQIPAGQTPGRMVALAQTGGSAAPAPAPTSTSPAVTVLLGGAAQAAAAAPASTPAAALLQPGSVIPAVVLAVVRAATPTAAATAAPGAALPSGDAVPAPPAGPAAGVAPTPLSGTGSTPDGAPAPTAGAGAAAPPAAAQTAAASPAAPPPPGAGAPQAARPAFDPPATAIPSPSPGLTPAPAPSAEAAAQTVAAPGLPAPPATAPLPAATPDQQASTPAPGSGPSPLPGPPRPVGQERPPETVPGRQAAGLPVPRKGGAPSEPSAVPAAPEQEPPDEAPPSQPPARPAGRGTPSPPPAGAPAPPPALTQGATVALKIVSVSPPAEPTSPAGPFPPPPDPAGDPNYADAGDGPLLAGTIAGRTGKGQPILATGAGMLALNTRADLPPGTIVVARPSDPALMPPPAGPLPVDLVDLALGGGRDFPALRQVLASLAGLDRLLAQSFLSTVVPQPNRKLGSALTFLVSAMRGGDAHGWLGGAAVSTLQRAGLGQRVADLEREFTELQAPPSEMARGEWAPFTLPMLDSTGLTPITLYLHTVNNQQQTPEDEGAPAQEKARRFLLDVELSRLGHLQLDGLVRERRFDLILRSYAPLAPDLRRDLEGSFANCLGAVGFAGGLSFQSGGRDWVELRRSGRGT